MNKNLMLINIRIRIRILFFISENAMDDEMRLIIENAVPFAIPVSIQLMLFVILSNYSTDKTK